MTAKVNAITPVYNLDMFEQLFNFIKDPEVDLQTAVKEFSGQTCYIPSYKTTFRNKEIIKIYRENYGQVGLVKRLARDYSLTERQIYDITRELRESPSLF